MKKLITLIFMSLLLTYTSLNAQVTNGLIEEFKFNNSHLAEIGIGVSVGGNGGTSFVTDRHNNANSALHINNSGASTTIPGLPYGNSERSFSFWVKLDEHHTSGYNFVFSYGTASSNRFNGVSVSPISTTYFAFGNDHGAVDATALNTWKHVVVTFSSGVSKIYSNGVLVGTDNSKTAWNTTNNNNILNFGASAGSEKYFKGAIDDFKIYNRAITAEEVMQLYGTLVPIQEFKFDNSFTNEAGNISFTEVNPIASFTADRYGNANKAIYIPANGLDAIIPNLPYGKSARTISFWTKLNNTNLNIFYYYGTNANQSAGFINSGFIYHSESQAAQSRYHAVSNTPQSNTWQHLIFSYDGVISKIYKNGILIGSAVADFNTVNNNNIFKLGVGNAAIGAFSFDGSIDDLKIFNRAVSDTEAALLSGIEANSLVQEFKFNNSYSNELGNISFSSNVGTSFTTDRNGNINSALNINNTGTTATISGLPYGYSPRTISFWAKVNVMRPDYNMTFSYGQLSDSNANGGSFNANTATYLGYNNNFDVATTNIVSSWYFFTYTYDGTTAKIFKNGIEIGSSQKNWNTINNSNIFKLGVGVGGELWFNGAIDDLRIHNYVLSGAEITTLYNTNTLPVNLTSFTAKAQNNSAILNWQTASETNNSHFVIQRSSDGINFIKIDTINAKSSTGASYNFLDKKPTNGKNYYQLLQVDLNGKTTDLGIRILNFGLSTFDVQLFPNPVNDIVNISFNAGKYHTLEIADVNGKILQRLAINKMQQNVSLDISNSVTGIYTLSLKGYTDNVVKKIVKR